MVDEETFWLQKEFHQPMMFAFPVTCYDLPVTFEYDRDAKKGCADLHEAANTPSSIVKSQLAMVGLILRQTPGTPRSLLPAVFSFGSH